MNNELAIYNLSDMQAMAEAVAKSGLFGMKSPEQALALMLVAQSENQHPATITQDYDIIQGKACRKTHSVMARFQQMGGKVEWHQLTDLVADATFSHPAGGSLRIEWTFDQAKKAGLTNKDNWKNYPRAMLRARVIAEGVRAVYPAAIGGMMVAEEAADSNEIDITPRRETGTQAASKVQRTEISNADKEKRQNIIADLELVRAESGKEAFRAAWKDMTAEHKELVSIAERNRIDALEPAAIDGEFSEIEGADHE